MTSFPRRQQLQCIWKLISKHSTWRTLPWSSTSYWLSRHWKSISEAPAAHQETSGIGTRFWISRSNPSPIIDHSSFSGVAALRALTWAEIAWRNGASGGVRWDKGTIIFMQVYNWNLFQDICWIRTNQNSPGHSKIHQESKAVFQRTKGEYRCLLISILV